MLTDQTETQTVCSGLMQWNCVRPQDYKPKVCLQNLGLFQLSTLRRQREKVFTFIASKHLETST